MAISMWYMLGCVINLIPGFPPGVKFEDTYFQLLPIDKTLCSSINPITDIRFEVYTSLYPAQSFRVPIGDDYALAVSRLNFNHPTIIFFHAFYEDTTSLTSQAIRQGFFVKGPHNLIFVHAQKLLAGPWYLTASKNTAVVGKYSALFVDYLVSRGLDLKKLHLIGLSLGGQTAGVCGQSIKSGRPARITGLDPAGPVFQKLPKDLRLDPTDAEFVAVIHSNAGMFGYDKSIGHADFWPNGGRKQPGCNIRDVKKRNPGVIVEKLFCSHWRSYQYFAESITEPESFMAIQCNSWTQFRQSRCNMSNIVPMGLATPSSARGNYYLETNSQPPFSKM